MSHSHSCLLVPTAPKQNRWKIELLCIYGPSFSTWNLCMHTLYVGQFRFYKVQTLLSTNILNQRLLWFSKNEFIFTFSLFLFLCKIINLIVSFLLFYVEFYFWQRPNLHSLFTMPCLTRVQLGKFGKPRISIEKKQCIELITKLSHNTLLWDPHIVRPHKIDDLF